MHPREDRDRRAGIDADDVLHREAGGEVEFAVPEVLRHFGPIGIQVVDIAEAFGS